MSLAVFTILLAVLIAVPLGVLAAYRHGSWLDRIVMGFSVLGFSVPVFVIGYLLIYVFAIQLNWLPVQGYQRLGQGVGGWLQRLILPSLTLSVVLIALIARITRTSVLEVMNEDYIRTARAKGQTERKVLIRHALANAAVPIVTVIGLGVAALIGGVVVTESVYTIPGLGSADRGCRAGPRLSDHPGRHPAVLARLRAHQPDRRPDLYLLRPEDPLLSIEALPAEMSEDRRPPRAGRERCACWRATRAWSSAPTIVAFLALVGLFAPLLGTIDPAEINPVFRNKKPGVERTIRADDGKESARSCTASAPTRSAATSTAASSTARACR